MTHRKTWLQPVVVLGLCLSAAALQAQYLETVIPVGESPVAILWNPVSNKVYTANNQTASVTIIDGATNQVLATVPVADYPVSFCWNSVGNKVYVTSGDPNWINVIDGVGDTLIKKIRTRGYPCNMAYNATMNKLYVNCADDDMIRVYEGAAETLVAEVWLGEYNTPYTLLWHPLTNRLFCTTNCDAGVDTVFVVDCETDAVVERQPVGNFPSAMCWNPVNNLVYVASGQGIQALTAPGDSILCEIQAYASDMHFAPFPNRVLAVAGVISIIDCDSNIVRSSIPVKAQAIAADTVHGNAYCTNFDASAVYVVGLRADTLVKTIAVGRYPCALAWNSTNNRVYVADDMDDVVYVIRDTSTAVAEYRCRPAGPRLGATVTRGALFLPGQRKADLFSISGTRIAMLRPGRNNLGALVPGTYFVRQEGEREVWKVVLAR